MKNGGYTTDFILNDIQGCTKKLYTHLCHFVERMHEKEMYHLCTILSTRGCYSDGDPNPHIYKLNDHTARTCAECLFKINQNYNVKVKQNQDTSRFTACIAKQMYDAIISDIGTHHNWMFNANEFFIYEDKQQL